MSDFHEAWIQAGQVKLHYLEWGKAQETLVCLHGTSMQAHAWTQLARDLQPQFRVIALNMRGHGLSDAPKTGYTVPQYGDDLLHFADALRLGRFHLAGSSLGTQVALHFAAHHPERTERVVLSDPSLAIEQPAIDGYVALHQSRPRSFATLQQARAYARALPQRAGLSEAMHALTEIGDFRKNHEGRFEWCYDLNGILETFRNLRIDQWPDVRRIEAPTLVMRAATSHVLSHDNALRLERELPNGTLVEIPNSSHTIWGDRPDLLSELTRSFLLGKAVERRIVATA
jgi:pimeloyl-ACP methyl ester carboxylesterase